MPRPGTPLHRFAAIVATFCAVLAFGGAAEAQKATKNLWWNDPLIVKEVGLDAKQRGKMDSSYAVFEEASAAARSNREGHSAFMAALEAGDWGRARKQLDSWKQGDVNPQYLMAELKLEILQMLSTEQRETLVESYPRILRRQWRPALTWKRGAGSGDAKPFQGAVKGPKKGQMKGGAGTP